MATPGQRKARQQEKEWAAKVGGKVNPGSGNGWRLKNDVRTPKFSDELKYTAAASFSLKLKDLLTAEKNALADGKEMRFVINLGGRNWIVMSDLTFDAMQDG
ncbi:hypothetical protein [Streptomyces sp. NPDC017448]|uniref:hypothetical protein n=1 Tax=Streptomyces sp. NPDC017448 TaxID=3364996 RepID=UPI0037AA4A45